MSHIIPRFVFRWLKETSVGAIRSTQRIQVRTQDGPKTYFLCGVCEAIFHQWETPFASNIFTPLHRSDSEIPRHIEYQHWGLLFATSISWRALAYFREQESYARVPVEAKHRTDHALEVWSQFLRGERHDPGDLEHHMLVFSGVARATAGVSTHLNRYLLRSVDHDLALGGDGALVYTKLGRIMLFGVIPGSRRNSGWGNATRLHLRKGTLSLGGYINIPQGVMAFINDRAEKARQKLAALSAVQRAKIDRNLADQKQHSPDAELFRATSLDEALETYQMPIDDSSEPGDA